MTQHTVRPMDKHPLNIGSFGIWLDAYWPQFAGRRETLAQLLRLEFTRVC